MNAANNTASICPSFLHPPAKLLSPAPALQRWEASEHNLTVFREHYSYQTIGPDKLNQLRHIYFFGNLDGVKLQMEKHRAILEPKFQVVQEKLETELGGKNVAEWTQPNGGYFVSVDVLDGCAKRVVSLCKEAGVTLTGAGATFPYQKDPRDREYPCGAHLSARF